MNAEAKQESSAKNAAIKIDKKIVSYHVKRPNDQQKVNQVESGNDLNRRADDNVIQLTEQLERPEMLVGSTYKIRTPLDEHALYITINDIILNSGTEHESRRPFEIFINSKNMQNFQWIVALTRIISAVFRKGGDVAFLSDELRSVFDPKGGYFKRGGKYMPSLVAEIGECIESHLQFIGLTQAPELDEHQKALLAEKRQQFEAHSNGQAKSTEIENGDFPENASLCPKCNVKAAVVMDGCVTCLNCGDSKCG